MFSPLHSFSILFLQQYVFIRCAELLFNSNTTLVINHHVTIGQEKNHIGDVFSGKCPVSTGDSAALAIT